MAYLRIISWLVSICVAMALQVQAAGNVISSSPFTQQYSENASVTDTAYYDISDAGAPHDFHETAHARRRYSDRSTFLCFNGSQDKTEDKLSEVPDVAHKCHSLFNNICLSSCYDYIFRLSPF